MLSAWPATVEHEGHISAARESVENLLGFGTFKAHLSSARFPLQSIQGLVVGFTGGFKAL